jgi:hypothetical protein
MVSRRWSDEVYHQRVLDRMYAKREINSSGCWIWLGWKNELGYGWTHFNGRKESVHRTAYTILVGAVPEGLHLDHLCRQRDCFNPDHLEPVTCAENLLRGAGPSARNAHKTHCWRGHEFSESNTWLEKNGARHCRACNRIRMRERTRPPDRGAGVTEVRIAERS